MNDAARRALQVAGVLAVYALYVFLARPSLGSYVLFPLAVGMLAGAWWVDARRGGNGWFKLAGLILATELLLAGRGWTGAIPWQSLFFTTLTILIFALFALGLNLEFGFGGLINFGHVAFMSLGAYTVALLALEGGLWHTQVGVLVAFLVALVVAGLAGMLLALPAVRLRADYLAIVTIAAAEILRRIFVNEREWTRGAQGIVVDGSARPLNMDAIASIPGIGGPLEAALFGLRDLLGFTGTPYLFVLATLALVATIGVVLLSERLVHSPWGRCLRAIREDDDAAEALGINPTVYKLQVFALGSAIAAVAGTLWAWQNAFVAPGQFLPVVTFWAWIMIVIGGVGNNKGAIAGAFIFWTINELTRSGEQLRQLGLDSQQIAAFATLALGLLLVGFMVFRPQGLFGDREELELVE